MAADNAYLVYVRWPTPLVHGSKYTVRIAGLTDEAGNAMIPQNVTFVFNSGRAAVADTAVNVTLFNTTAASNSSVRLGGLWTSSAIKVNQLGYLPLAPKMALIGDYVGESGVAATAVFTLSRGHVRVGGPHICCSRR